MRQPTNTTPFLLKTGERTVTSPQILQAMEKFDDRIRDRVPVKKGGWFVLENGRRYPPKWLLRLATDVPMRAFKGSEARKTLNELGFVPREIEIEDEVDDSNEADGEAPEGMKFGLERDLQDALRSNIEQLETGMKITDGGKEQMVESGRIDITAEDMHGSTVVIELKAGRAGRHAIGQLLAYMGDCSQGKEPIRGVLVAEKFSPQAIAAARVVPNLKLVQYNFKFAFQTVGSGPEKLATVK